MINSFASSSRRREPESKVEREQERVETESSWNKAWEQKQTAYVNFGARGVPGPDYVAPSAYSIKTKRARARVPTIRNFVRKASRLANHI